MNMLEQLVTSFIGTAGFSVLFNVPRRTVVQCGFVGLLGWLIYISCLEVPADPIIAALLASCVVAVISQICAKVYKTPIIVFSIAGIIPLVPGGTAYDAMRSFVEYDYETALQLAAKAFMISGAIAIGLVFSEAINQAIRKLKIN
ncbi:threonine/serine exporter family protein [Paenibacillus protaetiae]|uniref:Threonine/serine exporter n=1 Tax=Paenibacillus protaetiae TaxID=2509456 RepID=A0A4P6EWA3_9BACL|nr:threonine/serine exporter family protein [Paenibacillus protaetiae]QAY67630.1 threonine/serine exporter [Paenibacillus protaetiae]